MVVENSLQRRQSKGWTLAVIWVARVILVCAIAALLTPVGPWYMYTETHRWLVRGIVAASLLGLFWTESLRRKV